MFNDYAVTAEGELVEEFFIVAALVTLSTAAYPPFSFFCITLKPRVEWYKGL